MIGKILKYMRIKRGLKQRELSAIVNIPQNTISQYENEKIQPTFEIIEKIAKSCNFKIVFMGGEDNITTENIKRKEV